MRSFLIYTLLLVVSGQAMPDPGQRLAAELVALDVLAQRWQSECTGATCPPQPTSGDLAAIEAYLESAADQADTTQLKHRINALRSTFGLTLSSASASKGLAGSIQGSVRDESGAPLVGVQVRAVDASGLVAALTTTMSDGSYALSSVNGGDYFLLAQDPFGFVDEVWPDIQCIGRCVNFADGDIVNLPDNETVSDINFTLSAGAVMTGRVTDAVSGEPIEGAVVRVFDPFGNVYDDERSNAAGSYQFLGLGPGRYQACAESLINAYVSELFGGGDARFSCQSPLLSSGRAVRLSGGQNMGSVDLAMQPGGAVTGIAQLDDGTPIQDPQSFGFVLLLDSDGHWRGEVAIVGFEADPGRYFVVGVAPGDYYALFNSSSIPTTNRSLPVFEGLHTGQPCPAMNCAPSGGALTVERSALTEDVDFELTLGGRIGGVVTRASNGSALSAARIGVYDANGELQGIGLSGDGGVWRTQGAVEAGQWFAATFLDNGASGAPGDLQPQIFDGQSCGPSCDPTAGAVIAHDGANDTAGVDFSLTDAGAISGQILDQAGQAPDRPLLVRAYDSQGLSQAQAETTANGDYRLTGLAPGQYFVAVTADGPYPLTVFGVTDCQGCEPTDGSAVAVTVSTDASVDFDVAREDDRPVLDGRFSGPWFVTTRPGHGWLIEVLDGPGGPQTVNAYWYVYNGGDPYWLIGQGPIVDNTATLQMLATTGADFPPDFDAAAVSLIEWGTLTFEFFDDDTGQASWEPVLAGFNAGALPITRLANIAAAGDMSCRSGSYYDPEQNGHGYVVEVVDNGQGGHDVVLAWYVYLDGEQVWLFGQGPLVGDTAEATMSSFTGAFFPPGFSPGSVQSTPWGTVTMTFTGPDSANVSWETTRAEYADGTLDVIRLTGLSGHDCP